MASNSDLLRTPLSDWHAANGGRLVDFAGWGMPVQYGSIVGEHVATRTAVGLFDVSHMGRLTVQGGGAAERLDRLTTRCATSAPVGRVRYSLVCNESGGALDDILFTRVTASRFDLVVNASNRSKLLAWFAEFPAGDTTLIDRTEATAMIAVQGPGAVGLVASLADADVRSIRYYHAGEANVADAPCVVSRTGYTGEDGFELTVGAERAEALWQTLVDRGGKPCGLAARDTLRLEAGMPLYGHELDEETTPLEAGLEFAIDFAGPAGEARDFAGAAALRGLREAGLGRVRVGLVVEGKRPPREGYDVLAGGEKVGALTSGTASPTLGKGIAMAYVDPRYAEIGTALEVDVRGALTRAEVVPLPFYKRS